MQADLGPHVCETSFVGHRQGNVPRICCQLTIELDPCYNGLFNLRLIVKA